MKINNEFLKDDKPLATSGGHLLPETWLLDVERPGLFFASIRFVGEKVLRFGAWLRALGYSQKEIHPRREIWKKIREMK
jgi:hypothetical protein